MLQDGKGKGNALACGFAAARGDIIVMLDADGSTDPQEIPAYVDALFDGADFAKGSRFMEGGGSVDITPLRMQGNRFLNGTVNALFGTDYSDLCYGYNAFWSDVRPTINVDCAGFEVETLINVRAAKAGLNVAEVPSVEHERIHGVSKLRPFRDGFRVLRTILVERFARRAETQLAPAPAIRELDHDGMRVPRRTTSCATATGPVGLGHQPTRRVHEHASSFVAAAPGGSTTTAMFRTAATSNLKRWPRRNPGACTTSTSADSSFQSQTR